VRILDEILLIARFDLGTALRTRRAVLAVGLYALGALATGGVLVWIEGKVGDKVALVKAMADGAAAARGTDQDFEHAIGTLLGGDTELARHLLGIPLVVLGFFWVTLTFLPLLIALVSHDIVNSEVRNRSARFVLLRCSRTGLLLGKMASHGALFLAVTVVSNAVLFVYAWARLPAFAAGTAAVWLLRFWALTVVLGACYLSLAALVSSLVDGGGRALVTLVLVLFGLAILAQHPDVGFLSPSHWKTGLWSPRPEDLATSVAAFLGYAALFFGLAWARVARRDL